MKQRVISAAVLIVIVLACMIISPYTRVLLIAAAAIISIKEMINVNKLNGNISSNWVLYGYFICHAVLCALSIKMYIPLIYFVALAFFAMFCAMFDGIIKEPIHGKGAMATLAVIMYPLFPYAAVCMIVISKNWLAVVIIACLATWICDSFALFGGSRFGKHKVAPYVSPNKTVEGCITGAISSIVSGIISFLILLALGTHISIWLCMLISLVASTFGQVGDLAASLLKRMVSLKDYSNLIPGHGGMMDRADSLLFSIPVTWFMLYIASAL